MFLGNPMFMSGSGFSPSDLTALHAWYDADDISTLWQDSGRTTQASADGQTIGAWDDKSGNAYHMLQTTAADEPTYKTNILNGKPIIRGDGVSDYLVNSSIPISTPMHCFLVALRNRYTSPSGDTFFTDQNGFLYIASAPSDSRIETYSLYDSNMSTGAFYLVEAFFGASGDSHTLKVGDNTPQSGSGVNVTGTGLSLFDSYYGGTTAQIDVAEFVMCDDEVTGSELSDIRSYFNIKWGVTV